MNKPEMNYAMYYERFKGELGIALLNLQGKYPLPSFMVEGIISSILADIRGITLTDCTRENKGYEEKLEEYYSHIIKEKDDEILKLQAEKEDKNV